MQISVAKQVTHSNPQQQSSAPLRLADRRSELGAISLPSRKLIAETGRDFCVVPLATCLPEGASKGWQNLYLRSSIVHGLVSVATVLSAGTCLSSVGTVVARSFGVESGDIILPALCAAALGCISARATQILGVARERREEVIRSCRNGEEILPLAKDKAKLLSAARLEMTVATASLMLGSLSTYSGVMAAEGLATIPEPQGTLVQGLFIVTGVAFLALAHLCHQRGKQILEKI